MGKTPSFLYQFDPGTLETPPLSHLRDGRTVSGKIVLEAARQTFLTMLRQGAKPAHPSRGVTTQVDRLKAEDY